jgi:RND family efflux transporter MFP subunit
MSSLVLALLVLSASPPNRGFVGVIAPLRAKDISPDINAIVETIHVRAGDRVKVGDRIATLDARSLMESVAALAAELKAAQAAHRQTKIELDEAERKLETEKKLFAQGLAARQALDDATYAHQKSQAAFAQADSLIEQKTAELQRARRHVKETIVRAPFNGSIAARLAGEGVMVGPDAPIVRLIERDVLWVKFAMPPIEAAKLTLGAPVTVELETTGEKFKATTKQIAPELDPASHMIFVEAELILSPKELESIPSGVGAWVRPER